MIYEYLIDLQSHKTYSVIEAETLDEADRMLQIKYRFPGRFFTVHRAFSENRFEQLQESAKDVQTNLQVLLLQDDLEPFQTELEKFREKYAILVDREKKIVKVYPTLDPFFRIERKYHVLKQQSQTERKEKLA